MRDIPFAIEDGHSVLRSGEDGTGVTITSGTIDSAPSIQTPSRAGHGSGGRFAFWEGKPAESPIRILVLKSHILVV